jgi:hypothetical protein
MPWICKVCGKDLCPLDCKRIDPDWLLAKNILFILYTQVWEEVLSDADSFGPPQMIADLTSEDESSSEDVGDGGFWYL